MYCSYVLVLLKEVEKALETPNENCLLGYGTHPWRQVILKEQSNGIFISSLFINRTHLGP